MYKLIIFLVIYSFSLLLFFFSVVDFRTMKKIEVGAIWGLVAINLLFLWFRFHVLKLALFLLFVTVVVGLFQGFK